MAAKKPVKKASSKKSTKSKTVKKQLGPVKAISKKQTKVQIFQSIAELSEVPLKQVKAVFASANQVLQGHMVKKGSGQLVIPEMGIKVIRKVRPATKARMGRNPLTGEAIKISAKPKTEVIRVRALKSLKEALHAN